MNDSVTRRTMLGLGGAAACLGLTACTGPATPTAATSSATGGRDPRQSTLTDAYVFGYPLVLMDVTRAAAGPVNQLRHADTLPTPLDGHIARMNLDTLYSQAWLDLRPEPLILQVPNMGQVARGSVSTSTSASTSTSSATSMFNSSYAAGGGPKRYWVMQLMDAWTNTVYNPSSLHPRLQWGSTAYALTGPGWRGTLPAHVTPLPMPTATAWLLGRIQVNGLDDISRVRMLQQQLRLVPLSQWGKRPPPPQPVVARPPKPPALDLNSDNDLDAVPPAPNRQVAPANIVATMDGRTFFTRLSALLGATRAYPADQAALRRFAGAGIAPGADLNPIPNSVLDAAADDAKHFIAGYTDPQGRFVDGWTYAANVGRYGVDYLLRANVALCGLGADLPEDVLSPTMVGLADDKSGQRRFRLHFNTPPPVDAFWSLTAYNADGVLVSNPADIYAVGHQQPLATNSDGSLDIAVQYAEPGPRVREGNWLPIPPSGEFSLTLRMYAPKAQALNGTWKPPSLTPA